jgi:tRNA uridine 5-carboxymethylaminomethyl modification enzyme
LSNKEIHKFDIVVVGGGHAGIEACHAASRLGRSTALITHDAQDIGRLPCNPAIGGLGKGHLVREIDSLGGLMGRVIDQVGIQFRILNRRKGPAVQAPRAQADKYLYQQTMTKIIHGLQNVTVVEGDAADLIVDRDGEGTQIVRGVRLADGQEYQAERVILCSGTFMGGLMHTGRDQVAGGREGAAASYGLSASLSSLGFQLFRLKTGTPPRLHKDSIDYDRVKEQPGDPDASPFSHFSSHLNTNQVSCWMTKTNETSHGVIRDNLANSPLYAGIIEGQGPRYCPSIEDKVVRFPERLSHTVFLEPEGLDTPEVYVNGISTSLPRDIQEQVVRSIDGLEQARFLRYGYAVEYDSVPSWQVGSSLETSLVQGLYLAGQILGTSGYEEAAAQGLLAGVNAARACHGDTCVVLSRDQAYIGVMIDDLTTKDITEPYRMFTSRAEYRLSLRCDNTATRLLDISRNIGLLDEGDLMRLGARVGGVCSTVKVLNKHTVRVPGEEMPKSASDLLKRTGWSIQTIIEIDPELAVSGGLGLSASRELQSRDAQSEIENTIKYAGYVTRQDRWVRQRYHLDELEIPLGFSYADCHQMNSEAREKLTRIQPATIGQASRIDGVRASDLAVLAILVRKGRKQ